MTTLKVGDKFKLSADAVNNYGEQYANKQYTVRAVYTHYCKPDQMENDPSGHPGFDSGAGGALYGSELNFDVYVWEMIPVKFR